MAHKSGRTSRGMVSPKRVAVPKRAQSATADLHDPSIEPRKVKIPRKYTRSVPKPTVEPLKSVENLQKVRISAKKRAEERKNQAALVIRAAGEAAIEAARRRSSKNDLIEQLHAEGELSRALEFSENPRAAQLLSDMVDPRYKEWSISALCSKNGFSPLTVVDVWRNHMLAKANIEFLRASPEVSKHVVEDAKSVQICCPRCDGFGKVGREVPGPLSADGQPTTAVESIRCPNCKGQGTVRKAGDSDSRKLMYTAIGVIGKPQAGAQVNLTLQSVASLIDDDDKLVGNIINIDKDPGA